jgi:TRAP-type C4-dicarboxylate transport system substrate-binding protein
LLSFLLQISCGSFESLPLKTQKALREGLSVARNAIIDAAIKREEELKKSFSSGVMCGMIRQSFPSLL